MSYSFSFGGPVTPAVRGLIIANVAVFIACLPLPELTDRLLLDPSKVVEELALWRIVTYAFAHADPMHLIFNMLSLWMFGSQVERAWNSSRRFFTFYMACCLGAALLTFALNYHARVLGASGGVLGVLAAFACMFPEDIVMFMAIFPMRAKYMALIVAAVDFVFAVQAGGPGTGVAHFAYLGGMATGFVLVKFGPNTGRWLQRMGSGPRPGGGRRLKVVQSVRTPPEVPVRKAEDTSLQQKVDVILDKIRTEGMSALTPEERRFLEEASRRLKERND